MSSDLYTRLQDKASSLIAKYGATGTLRKYTNTGSSYDPTRTPTDAVCRYIKLKNEVVSSPDSKVRRDDIRLYIAASDIDFAPQEGHYVVLGSEEFQIIQLMPLEPADVSILYEAYVRK